MAIKIVSPEKADKQPKTKPMREMGAFRGGSGSRPRLL